MTDQAGDDLEPFVALGINYGGHDTSAAIMRDGTLIAACEQERYDLQKHSRAFPIDAVKDCLRIAGVRLEDLSEVSISFDPAYHIREMHLRPALSSYERLRVLIDEVDQIKHTFHLEEIIREQLGYQGLVKNYNHHQCHLASAYFPSGFSDALIVSIDGVGEVESGVFAHGSDGEIEVISDAMRYPHSLGLLYSGITYFLGWKHHCDEGIVMGLAPFGDANAVIAGDGRRYIDVFREIVLDTGPLTYSLDLSWIAYHEARDTWVSEKFRSLFGEPRLPHEPLTDHHKNIAAALQARLEEVVLKHIEEARDMTKTRHLCIAGGVGLNCSMNGKVAAAGLFDEIFVQPASGDAGVAVGACILANKAKNAAMKPERTHNYYLGFGAEDDEIEKAFSNNQLPVRKSDDVSDFTARKLADGLIVGWYQGRAEFGPRALGNRSILTRPYPEAARDNLNERVKFRELFRPFAPAVLADRLHDFFNISQESPHMLIACQARPGRREEIPATIHVDNSCRVQSVRHEQNKRFHELLTAFDNLTGCPVLLNTSFNVKGQPIVNTPEQAVKCFLSTNIDILVVGDYIAEKEIETS